MGLLIFDGGVREYERCLPDLNLSLAVTALVAMKAGFIFASTAEARIFSYYETAKWFGLWPVSKLCRLVKHALALFLGNKLVCNNISA